jgi:hypothetical protein
MTEAKSSLEGQTAGIGKAAMTKNNNISMRRRV